jgi:hypothetical protein
MMMAAMPILSAWTLLPQGKGLSCETCAIIAAASRFDLVKRDRWNLSRPKRSTGLSERNPWVCRIFLVYEGILPVLLVLKLPGSGPISMLQYWKIRCSYGGSKDH